MTYTPIDDKVWLNTGDQALFPFPVDQLDLIRRTYRQYGWTEPDDFPDMQLIEGYGLPPEDNMFQRETTPRALVELEKTIRLDLRPKAKGKELSPARREIATIERFWEALDADQVKYAEEIEWLKRMWYYRLFGKFFLNNGKVTYITGDHWFFLNYYKLNNGGFPGYRDRDRRWYIALKYLEVSTETFANVDPDTSLPIPEPDGTYKMKDLGHRVFYGMNNPKMRREGASSRYSSSMLSYSTRKKEGKAGLQAKDDYTATEVLFPEHYVQVFIKLPIFWKPIFDSATGIAPKSGFLFDNLDDIDFGLHSRIDVATSSGKSKFDGSFLHRYHGDEFGKLDRSDPNEVVDVVKFCLSTGGGNAIHGFAWIGSTVEEIKEESAGENYKRFCERSKFEVRDQSGQTSSGFVTIFFSSYDGLEGYIGPYGESVIDDPTPDQARFMGKTFGSKKYLDGKIAAYRKQKDFVGLANFRRQYPLCYNDCFIPPPSSQLLARDLIETQIQVLESHPELQAIRGDLMWTNGYDSTVVFIPNIESGRFYLSRKFLDMEANQKYFRDNSWYPLYPDRSVASADTFATDQVMGRKSNGSILVRWRRDVILDPLEREISDIQSDRDILTYSFRPNTVSEYCEDCIMACVYTGAMMYPERNRTNVIDHFRKRGYEGYLLYNVDRNTGKREPNPGWWNKNELVEAAIRWLDEDIKKNITRCYHLDLLKEYLEFGGRQDLTNLDLMVAKLGVIIAERNPYYKCIDNSSKDFDVTGWIPWYNDG